MSDTVIQVENLGKKYIIGHQQAGAYQYNALRDVIVDSVRSLGRKIRHPRKAMQPDNQEEFWALKDVSFEVKRGEVVGIIGRNGAGKSTLLKILSRITEPTTGRVKLKGRVASLLEVGTGFHPELTGRENIFLNGAILGMGKAEINRKFDEIVEFAEIYRFLDTPVKRYSSGMYVRLAFAVAAHLEPEILVVDEVLAVGDIEFQKKCLGKMKNISTQGGRTVIFVSHNMAAIRRLCEVGICLEKGKLRAIGESQAVVEDYLKSIERIPSRAADHDRENYIITASIISDTGVKQDTLNPRNSYFLSLKVNSNTKNLNLGFTIFNSEDVGIFSGITSDTLPYIPEGLVNLKIRIPSDVLNAGFYRVEASLGDHGRVYDSSDCLASFQVLRDSDFESRGGKPAGLLRINSPWIIESTSKDTFPSC